MTLFHWEKLSPAEFQQLQEYALCEFIFYYYYYYYVSPGSYGGPRYPCTMVAPALCPKKRKPPNFGQ